jgi:zinc/manganese transport system permease protein
MLFSSIDEDVAEAKGIRLLPIGLLFMLILAVTTSIAVQVVGVLLIFALLVTPAAVANKVAKTPAEGMLLSVILALSATWIGLFIGYYLPYPVSFFIISIVFLEYLFVSAVTSWRAS